MPALRNPHDRFPAGTRLPHAPGATVWDPKAVHRTRLPGTPGAGTDLSWQDWAKCAGSELDFHEDVEGARAVCDGDDGHPPCPVRAACRAWAEATDQRSGIWGGIDFDKWRSARRESKRKTDKERRAS